MLIGIFVGCGPTGEAPSTGAPPKIGQTKERVSSAPFTPCTLDEPPERLQLQQPTVDRTRTQVSFPVTNISAQEALARVELTVVGASGLQIADPPTEYDLAPNATTLVTLPLATTDTGAMRAALRVNATFDDGESRVNVSPAILVQRSATGALQSMPEPAADPVVIQRPATTPLTLPAGLENVTIPPPGPAATVALVKKLGLPYTPSAVPFGATSSGPNGARASQGTTPMTSYSVTWCFEQYTEPRFRAFRLVSV